jgi:hypothetical protein
LTSIHPRYEPLLRGMIDKSGESAGWRLQSFQLLSSEVRALFEGHGARVQIKLSRPEISTPEAAKRTEKFLFSVASSSRDPSVRELVVSVLQNVRSKESDFSWEDETRAAPAAKPEPDQDDNNLWEAMREVDHHLDYRPFIDLGVSFDHAACFAEGAALLNSFNQHCSGVDGELSKGWKSLAIRSQGGQAYRDHAVAQMSESGSAADCDFTPFAEKCPQTLAFLSSLFDLEKTTTIRFMVLEPGGLIPIHTDNPDVTVVHSVNIALNMPEGCLFTIDAAKSGKATPYTKLAPFQDGTALLLNVAKYHTVVNRASIPRLHLKIEGPLRMNQAGVRQIARKQNGFKSAAEVLTALVEKYRALGQPLRACSTLVEDAVRFGVLPSNSSEVVA